ncbi:MAG: tyrosine phosphatase family protein, partial [Hyphococcus sp.]
WDEDAAKSPILIHCNEGAARSMAIAYILLCAIDRDHSEKDLAARLRQAAPHADPNLLLISEADAALGRDDRMVEAILDLCPSCSTAGAPVVTLPVAA